MSRAPSPLLTSVRAYLQQHPDATRAELVEAMKKQHPGTETVTIGRMHRKVTATSSDPVTPPVPEPSPSKTRKVVKVDGYDDDKSGSGKKTGGPNPRVREPAGPGPDPEPEPDPEPPAQRPPAPVPAVAVPPDQSKPAGKQKRRQRAPGGPYGHLFGG